MFSTILVAVSVFGCLSAPTDEPIRVGLPVYDQPQLGSDVYLAQALEPENYGQPKNDHSIVGNLLSHKINAATNTFGNTVSSSSLKAGSLNIQGAGGWFSPPVTTLEGALLETEGLGSKTLSVKDNLHHIVAGILHPKPIVDTIREEEKYGNAGDKFYNAGRAVVQGAEGVSNFVNAIIEPKPIVDTIREEEKYGNAGDKFYNAGRAVVQGAEGVSNFVNAIIEVPGTILKKITKAASEKLNNLGGKLIGL